MEASEEEKERVLLLLTKACENDKVFSKLDLKRCRRLGSFQMIQRNAEIKAIQRIFDEAKLNARMGYNLGSQDLSFTISMPSAKRNSKEQLLSLWENSARSLIIWFMLGISPLQHDLEDISNEHMGNKCLEIFKKQAGIAICKRTLDLPRQTLRVVLCPEEDTFDPATGRIEFLYSPSYSTITGLSSDRTEFTAEELERQKSEFIATMLRSFWNYMEEKQHYLAVDTLREALTVSLADYFQRGMDGQEARFLPPYSTPFYFYLFGTAGIGKSAFVRALCGSLQFVLREYVDPNKVVQVVKVPLNAFTPGNLRGILRVKGISDMSIERIIEQTICKGGIVIFHLEENPDDPSLQEQLFSQTSNMLEHLVSRYPEYRANILTVMTSNYSPSETIANLATLLKMSPPSHDQQFRWCTMMLLDCLEKMTKNSIAITLDARVKTVCVDDLRPLEQWWRSIAFSIGSYILERDTTQVKSLQIIIDGELDCLQITFPNQHWDMLPLYSSNCFFYYKKEFCNDEIITQHKLPSHVAPMLTTIVHMAKEEFLKPAVIVLLGEPADRHKWIIALRSYLTHLFGDRLNERELELFTEDDKAKVFGNPNEILGGLFRFIDGVNNPNACQGETDRFGLITSHVNEIGQFILRELLEPGHSKTHRQRAKKNRLLFVLSLVEYSQLTPQVHSRSHLIVPC